MFPQTDQFHSLLSLWTLCTDWCTTAMLIYIYIHPHQKLEIKYKERLKVSHNTPTIYLLPFRSNQSVLKLRVWVRLHVSEEVGGGGLRNVNNQDTYIFNPSKKTQNFKFIYFFFIFGVFLAVSNFHECIIIIL